MTPFVGSLLGQRVLVLAFSVENEETVAVVAYIGGRLETVALEYLKVWRPTSEWPVGEGQFWEYVHPEAVRR